MTMRDKESFTQMLKDKIIHLCKAHALYSGQVEIDALICISGQVEGQELVVKVHEIFAAPHDLTSPYHRTAATTGYPYIRRLIADYPGPPDLKRRRLEGENDFKMATAELFYSPYSHLSKLIYDRSSHLHHHHHLHPSAFTEPSIDPQRNGVTDLSIKSLIGPAHTAGSIDRRDNIGNRSSLSSPLQQNLDTIYDVTVEGGLGGGTVSAPVESLLATTFFRKKQSPTTTTNERWSPNKPLPTVPQCRLCGYKFESSELLGEHNESVHSVFTCLCCFKTFTSRSNLERHSRLHTGHRPYSCDICGKAFSRKDHLSNHSTKHAFKCGTCSKRYADRNALVAHCLFVHGAALTDVCSFCNKGFCSSNAYEEHLKTHPQLQHQVDRSRDRRRPAPTAVERYACSGCSFESSDRVSYLKHRLVHADGRRCYVCRACAKVFDDPLLYTDHLLLHRNETDVFECCLCRHVCGTLASLRRHEAMHAYDDDLEPTKTQQTATTMSGDELYDCDWCEKNFETYGDLRKHTEVHELVKRDVDTYNVTFDDSDALRRHVKAHGGPSEVSCNDGIPRDDFSSDGAGVRNRAFRRDKRKQKQPKLAMSVVRDLEGAVGGAGDSEIEVVEPESPDDVMTTSFVVAAEDDNNRKNDDFVITDNPTCVIQVTTSSDVEIKMEPVRSIMNRPSGTSMKIRDHSRSIPDILPSSFVRNVVGDQSVKLEASSDDVSLMTSYATSFPPSPVVRLGGVSPAPPPPRRPKHASSVRSILKRRYQRKRDGSHGSGRFSAISDGCGLLNGGGGAGLNNNNNTIGTKNENDPTNATNFAPSGSFSCAICGGEADTFQQLENHCFATHSRSPCMFCAKTFAQKANRDRHHCLHTGEKPYGCPDCNERFSRGDKLKMHRIRTHGIQYPAYGSRHRGDGGGSRDREFSASPPPPPPSFLGLPPDGALYFGAFPSLPVVVGGGGNGLEVVGDAVVSSRPGSSGVLADDAIVDGVCYPTQMEMPETLTRLMNRWLTEKQANDRQMTGDDGRPEDEDDVDDDGPKSNKP